MELKKSYFVERTYEQFYTGGKVKVTADGEHLFCVCESSVKVLELSTLRTLQTIEEDDDTLTCFAVGGDWLLIAWRSLLVRQYNWKDSVKCVKQWKAHTGPVMAMEFDPTSTLLATGSGDGIIKVWDIEKQYCTHNFKDHCGVVSLVQFHPKQLLLFTSASDNKIKVWDLKTSSQVLDGHVSAVSSLTVSTNGQMLVSAGRDKVLNLWNISNGERIKTLPVYESVEGVVTLPTGKDQVVVAIAGSKGAISGWNMLTGNKVGGASQSLCSGIEYTDLQYCKGLGHLVGVSTDNNISLHSTDDFNLLKHYVGYFDEILDIKCSDTVTAVATNSELIKVFNTSDASCTVLTGHTDTVMAIDMSASGDVLVSGSKDNTVRLWRRGIDGMYSCCAEGRGHTSSVSSVACARSCSLVPFVVSAGQDHTLKLWKTQSVWDTSEAMCLLSVVNTEIAHKKDINSIDVSPNDKLIISGSQDKSAKLWLTHDLSLHGTLIGHKRGIWSVQFSPVDQCVLTSSADGTVRLWSIADLSCLKTFEGHNTSVLKAVFINHGMQFISADNTGVVKVWLIKSQECISTMDKHSDRVWAISTANDGDTVLTGGADSVIYHWKDNTKQVEDEERAQQEDIIVKEQDLRNLIHQKEFARAVKVALSLSQPYKVLNLLNSILDDESMEGEFQSTILSLTDEDRRALLSHVVKWNTNSKHCRVAQCVLNVMLKWIPPEDLLNIEGMDELLKGLIPYTERHFQRLSRLKQLSSFIDYTWQCIKLPEEMTADQ